MSFGHIMGRDRKNAFGSGGFSVCPFIAVLPNTDPMPAGVHSE